MTDHCFFTTICNQDIWKEKKINWELINYV